MEKEEFDITLCLFDPADPGPYEQYILPHITAEMRQDPEDYAALGAQAYGAIESKPAEADQLSWIRPVAPFLPKSQNEYFEIEPSAKVFEDYMQEHVVIEAHKVLDNK